MPPILFVVAGANGSGKTTFALKFTQKHNLVFINADEIAKSIDPNNINRAKVTAGRLFFKQFKIQLAQYKSFIIESTLSGHYLIKYLEEAKSLGYEIHLMYLFLDDPAMNIKRVQVRVNNGGHSVPESDIVRRFYRSKQLFWKTYQKLCDKWMLLYNSDSHFEEIAFGYNKNTCENDTILNPALFNKFKGDNL